MGVVVGIVVPVLMVSGGSGGGCHGGCCRHGHGRGRVDVVVWRW